MTLLEAAPPKIASRELRARRIALGAVVALVTLAVVLPPVFQWHVHVGGVPPLFADWDPRVGPGTLPSVAIGALVVVFGARVAERTGWRRLLAASLAVSVAWIVALATVDGWWGISHVFESHSEYLRPARQVGDVLAMLRGFADRIPANAPGAWPTHVAGDPPAAFLFFVFLVEAGLGSGLASGLIVIVIAATTPAAVLIAVRRLGAEAGARRAAPFLVAGPAAIFMGVSADAMFGAVAAWGLCLLAIAATSSRRGRRLVWATGAGLVLGLCVFLSYGLTLLAVPALVILAVARSWRPLVPAVGAAIAVALGFAALGFSWWQAYPLLVARYWSGLATVRPGGYWIWANLADLVLCAGLIVGPAVVVAVLRVRHTRDPDRAIVLLTLAGAAMVALADSSDLSRSEVERIWLPFVPWLLLGTALLPAKWRRWGLAGGVVLALVIQHLLRTAW